MIPELPNRSQELAVGLAWATLYVESINHLNGWYDKPRPFESDVALLHSEVSELLEAYRKRQDNMGEEIADIFIRLLDTCGRYNFDLFTEFVNKCRKNARREYRHGNLVV